MKSIGISDEIYQRLLNAKHIFEKQEGRILSYDEIIKKLLNNNFGTKIESDTLS